MVNYSPNVLKRHPPCLNKYYDNIQSVSTSLDTNECCNHEHFENEDEIDDFVSESNDLIEGLHNWDQTINV